MKQCNLRSLPYLEHKKERSCGAGWLRIFTPPLGARITLSMVPTMLTSVSSSAKEGY